jgi:hypothetical protein
MQKKMLAMWGLFGQKSTIILDFTFQPQYL